MSKTSYRCDLPIYSNHIKNIVIVIQTHIRKLEAIIPLDILANYSPPFTRAILLPFKSYKAKLKSISMRNPVRTGKSPNSNGIEAKNQVGMTRPQLLLLIWGRVSVSPCSLFPGPCIQCWYYPRRADIACIQCGGDTLLKI